jgi:ubiquinone/menaquinone biosynthesis C-methylase UbiE
MAIPFYGSSNPELFRIEREAMDRQGLVVANLESTLPDHGMVLDIGAGNGHTASLLTTAERNVVAAEPASGMIDHETELAWVQAIAQQLPFGTDSFDGTYATWAYFFPSFIDISDGLAEIRRVTKPGGPIVIVDNAGDDPFTAMAGEDIATDLGFWAQEGFSIEILESSFDFESMEDAESLLRLYFGERAVPNLTLAFRIAVMTTTA